MLACLADLLLPLLPAVHIGSVSSCCFEAFLAVHSAAGVFNHRQRDSKYRA
jgi:hypothetical protein